MKTVDVKQIMEDLMFPEGYLKDIYSMPLFIRCIVGNAIVFPVMRRMRPVYGPLTGSIMKMIRIIDRRYYIPRFGIASYR